MHKNQTIDNVWRELSSKYINIRYMNVLKFRLDVVGSKYDKKFINLRVIFKPMSKYPKLSTQDINLNAHVIGRIIQIV